MFFWFLGTAAITVWAVFRDDRFDYRVLFLGVLVVDLVDAAFGGARVLHSVAASVCILAAVMVLTRRGGAPRRIWLALPIGMFLHLVFDGAFANSRVFWWPTQAIVSRLFSTGTVGWLDAFEGAALPSAERGAWNLLLEVVGLALLVHLWRLHGLGDAPRRAQFVRDGRLRLSDGSRSSMGTGTC